MKLLIGGVLGDAAALWRGDRDLIVRIAGVFFVLPLLALAMLATGIEVAPDATGEQLRETISAFYAANLVWLLLISLALDYGALVMMSLFLRGDVTVRDLLTGAAVRLLPFALIGFANGALINLGFTLFVIPGLYAFGRTWMMGAAFAHAPEKGVLAAVERGFRLSAGQGWWIAMLGVGTVAIAGAAALSLLIVVQLVGTLAGGAAWLAAVLLVPVSAAGAGAYVVFTLVRVAIYRRLAGSITGT